MCVHTTCVRACLHDQCREQAPPGDSGLMFEIASPHQPPALGSVEVRLSEVAQKSARLAGYPLERNVLIELANVQRHK